MEELAAFILIAYIFKIFSCQSIVETNSGYIKSVAAELDDVEAFLGIPFAEPPIGDLRFAKPVPKQPWTKIYDASSLPPPCMQYSLYPYEFFPDTSNMSEDCLYLNVWKPKAKPNGFFRPVIIYFHYGGFVLGSSNQKQLDGSHLASKGDVVVVTTNYRLGPFGFFLADVEEAAGNMGMFDQIMAIEWVKDNALYFEGDLDNIILMGSSAGAMSISAHIISPLSRNLFRRAIFLSGTILGPVWLDGNEKLIKSSEQVASMAGCTNETVTLRSDPRSVLKCLKERPKEVLLEAHARLLKSSPVTFYPRVGDKFLPEDPMSVYREGKISKEIEVMFGSNKDEGSFFMLLSLKDYLGLYGKNHLKLSKSLATNLIRLLSSALKLKKNPLEIINYYLGRVKSPESDGYVKAISEIAADFMISCSAVFAADFLSLKGNSVYFHKFGHRAAASPFADWVGVTHCEDTQYVFGKPFHGSFTPEDVDISDRIIARLSAFVYTGNPNVPGQLPWLQYSYSNPFYLNIGQDEESIRLKPWDRCEIWRKEFNAEIDYDLSGESRYGINSESEIDSSVTPNDFISDIDNDINGKTLSGMDSSNKTCSFLTILIMMLMILLLRDSFITT